MDVLSLEALAFLAAVALLLAIAGWSASPASRNARLAVLSLANLAFLGIAHPAAPAVFLATTVAAWGLARLAARGLAAPLFAALVVPIASLLFLPKLGIFGESAGAAGLSGFAAAFAKAPAFSWDAPTSRCARSRWSSTRAASARRSPSLLETIAWNGFFPTIVAGPIERSQHFAESLDRIGKPNVDDLLEGAWRIFLGLLKRWCCRSSPSPGPSRCSISSTARSRARSGVGRPLRLRPLFLLRFLRIQRPRHRRGSDVWDSDRGELRQPLPPTQHIGVLADLAHFAVDLDPRLRLRADVRAEHESVEAARGERRVDGFMWALARADGRLGGVGRLPRRGALGPSKLGFVPAAALQAEAKVGEVEARLGRLHILDIQFLGIRLDLDRLRDRGAGDHAAVPAAPGGRLSGDRSNASKCRGLDRFRAVRCIQGRCPRRRIPSSSC